MPIRTPAETALVEAFALARERLPGDPDVRARAFAPLEKGLPHRRIEEWKYTDLHALLREVKPLAAPPDAAAVKAIRKGGLPLGKAEAIRLVLVNGSFVPALSDLDALPAGVEVVPLGRALAEGQPWLARLGEAGAPADNAAVALAAAFAGDGVMIRLAAGAEVERPILLAHVQQGDGHAAYARSLVIAEARASATLVESHSGPGAHQTGSLLEILAGQGASLRHVKLQGEAAGTVHLATLAVRLDAAAAIDSLVVERGAALARQQMFVTFAGEGARAALKGVTLAGGIRHLDTTAVIDHAVPGCISTEQFKAVIDGRARAVFQGRINVAPRAQKTDARMVMRALMLSEGSEADLKPELWINADDVQCAHGATASAIDEEQIFYLAARGIPRPEAETMLVEAFVAEVLDAAPEAVRAAARALAATWLKERD
ncbi:MAG TPA: Fe-S cluster assembly protein SufD [Hyphomicrobiales bacterium]|nr:Fe-S cluster assembly protein SufD [Hyphomicrobiales bacterium]